MMYIFTKYLMDSYISSLSPARKVLFHLQMDEFLDTTDVGEKGLLFILALSHMFCIIGVMAWLILWIISLT